MRHIVVTHLFFISLFLCNCSGYEIKKEAVFYYYWNENQGTVVREITEANPDNFKVLNYETYAKDNFSVFYKGSLIIGADAPSFKSLKEWYARDIYTGFYEDKRIKQSNGKNFRVIGNNYSTDETDVFFYTEPLNVCSTEDFKFVFNDSDNWVTDGCYYYYHDSRIPSSDYNEIKVYKGSGGFAKDSRHVYYQDRLANYNYEGEKVIDTIDVVSFEATGYLEGKDKFGCINTTGRTPCK